MRGVRIHYVFCMFGLQQSLGNRDVENELASDNHKDGMHLKRTSGIHFLAGVLYVAPPTSSAGAFVRQVL